METAVIDFGVAAFYAGVTAVSVLGLAVSIPANQKVMSAVLAACVLANGAAAADAVIDGIENRENWQPLHVRAQHIQTLTVD